MFKDVEWCCSLTNCFGNVDIRFNFQPGEKTVVMRQERGCKVAIRNEICLSPPSMMVEGAVLSVSHAPRSFDGKLCLKLSIPMYRWSSE